MKVPVLRDASVARVSARLTESPTSESACGAGRAGGSGGYAMFKRASVYYRSAEEIRELMIRHFVEKKSLPAKADGNWRVIPASAAAILASEASTESRRGENK